jgi:ubiquitin-protein ligase E3 C
LLFPLCRDKELFKNLMFLKTFTGDAADLMLSFSVTENILGVATEMNLCPNGSNVEVTSNNKLKYVYQMANYRLNTKIKKQCDAFLSGLRDIIPVDW